jgi:hypothetical protein
LHQSIMHRFLKAHCQWSTKDRVNKKSYLGVLEAPGVAFVPLAGRASAVPDGAIPVGITVGACWTEVVVGTGILGGLRQRGQLNQMR